MSGDVDGAFDGKCDSYPESWDFDTTNCPSAKCEAIGTCRNCADKKGCGWSGCRNQCVDGTRQGPSDPFFCGRGLFTKNRAVCPVVTCLGITKCSECAGRLGCGWCKDSSTAAGDEGTCFLGTAAGPTNTNQCLNKSLWVIINSGCPK